jgi:hypothetical protein
MVDPPRLQTLKRLDNLLLWSLVVHGSTKPEPPMILGSTGCQSVPFRQLGEKLFANWCRHAFLVVGKLPTTAGQRPALPGLPRLRDHSIN